MQRRNTLIVKDVFGSVGTFTQVQEQGTGKRHYFVASPMGNTYLVSPKEFRETLRMIGGRILRRTNINNLLQEDEMKNL